MRWESSRNLSGYFPESVPFTNDEPQLELPLALPARQVSRTTPALLLLLGLIGGGVYAATDTDTKPTARIPSRSEDLSPNVVTFVSPDDRAAVAPAVAAVKIAPPQRAEITQAVAERRQRLGWIVFTDSMDPDGDTVAVEASGLTQQIVLTKSWTPEAVALADGGRTASPRFGQGGGITVALRPAAARCRYASSGPANGSR